MNRKEQSFFNFEAAQCAVLHYSEIGLKGRNRPLFVDRLRHQLEKTTRPFGAGRVQKLPGRLLLGLGEGVDWPEVCGALTRVFGLAYFARAFRVPLDLDFVCETALKMIAPLHISTFRVRTRKGFESVPISTREWNAIIGGRIQARRHLPVNLEMPQTTVTVEALPDEAIVYSERVSGPGGLPVGISGRVAAMLSGGIDSPVAAYRMLKRGCEVVFVHFHGAPYVSRASAEKALDLAKILDGYQLGSRIYLVPFGNLQKEIVLSTAPASRVVLYRRFMARITDRIATLENAKAIVTGESLGQVASQTLSNLIAIEEAVDTPILRPLLGMDKEEIVSEAKAIGTYEISIEPDQDCCSLFVPGRPAVRSASTHLRKLESAMKVERMVEQALMESEVLDIRRGKRPQARHFSEVFSLENSSASREAESIGSGNSKFAR